MKRKRVNPLVRHPLLRKGGPHRKTNKALRKVARQRLACADMR